MTHTTMTHTTMRKLWLFVFLFFNHRTLFIWPFRLFWQWVTFVLIKTLFVVIRMRTGWTLALRNRALFNKVWFTLSGFVALFVIAFFIGATSTDHSLAILTSYRVNCNHALVRIFTFTRSVGFSVLANLTRNVYATSSFFIGDVRFFAVFVADYVVASVRAVI